MKRYKKPEAFSTPTFKEEQSKWYAMIEEAGFVDIEHDEQHLKQYSQIVPNNVATEATAAYFRYVSHFLHSDAPLSPQEREILTLHGEGLSNRAIAGLLRAAPRTIDRRVSALAIRVKRAAGFR